MMCRGLVILYMLLAMLPFAKAQLNTERIMEIGRNALYFEDYVLSIQYFNKVVEAKPFLHEPYFFRGLAKFYLDDYKGAEKDLDKAIEKNPYVSRSYQLRGMCRAKSDSLVAAEADFRMAIKYDPQNPILWQNLAATAYQGEQWSRAAEVVDSLLLFAPRYTTAYLMRAQIAMKLDDSITAFRMADEAVKTDAYSCDVYEMRAMVNAEYGRYAVAEEDLDTSINLLPGRVGSYVNRALMRYRQNNLRGAMEDYDMALYVEPADFIAHYNRGLLRMQLGDDNRAIEDFDFVLGVDPDNTMARFNRALLHDQTGDLRRAIDDYSRVLADYPNFEYGYRCRAAARRKAGDIKGATADEAWLLEHMTAVQTGQTKQDADAGDDKTRKRSDRNVSNYNKMMVADEEYGQNYATEYRGKVQNRNIPVEPEPMFALTYYKDAQELRAPAYYKPLEDMNSQGLLSYKAMLTNCERALAAHEVDRHFTNIDNLSKSIAENPDNMYYRLSRALDYYLVQDLAAAIDDLDAAFMLQGDLWIVYFTRAFVRYKLLESEQLDKMNSTGNGVAVKRETALPNMNYMLIKSDLDKVVELMPDFAYGYYNRANLLMDLNDFKGAVVDYTEAIEINPQFAEAYFNRGLANMYMGNTEAGAADLSKAGELGIYSAYNAIKRNKEGDE
ncbi:MAG: tetratricopeptide repeat protein [Bacteroidaceae bacterium]|nr:tetratricopeptide repeat protein [Bacteroidaceae bacterium]